MQRSSDKSNFPQKTFTDIQRSPQQLLCQLKQALVQKFIRLFKKKKNKEFKKIYKKISHCSTQTPRRRKRTHKHRQNK